MRRIILASLLSSIALTAAAATGKTPNDADTPAVRPVSTGVTSPRLVYSTRITISSSELPPTVTGSRVVLRFKLDTTGTPQNIHVVEPLTQAIDARVIGAVRGFRWSPAVLNNQVVPIDMNLVIQVQR